MIISHKHKFIFIHVWKTGGNSIRNKLNVYSEALHPQKNGQFSEHLDTLQAQASTLYNSKIDHHISLSALRTIIDPNTFDNYFKFAFVRNPLDLVVSYYHFIVQRENNHPQKELIRSFKSFEDYVKWSEENEMHKIAQKQFLFDNQGIQLVNHIGRFERLQDSFNEILKLINLEPIELAKLNASDHDHYSTYYSSGTEEIVRNKLAEDFDTFQY